MFRYKRMTLILICLSVVSFLFVLKHYRLLRRGNSNLIPIIGLSNTDNNIVVTLSDQNTPHEAIRYENENIDIDEELKNHMHTPVREDSHRANTDEDTESTYETEDANDNIDITAREDTRRTYIRGENGITYAYGFLNDNVNITADGFTQLEAMRNKNEPINENDELHDNMITTANENNTPQHKVIRDGNEIIAKYEDLHDKVTLKESYFQLSEKQTPQGSLCHQCRFPRPTFLHASKPFVALASFPGSGNSWTRELIESITGIYTGSVYSDSKGQFPGSKRCPLRGGVYVVKTHHTGYGMHHHDCKNMHAVKYKKAMYILRNPYNAILATFNLVKGGKVAFASRQAFQTDWKTYVQKKAAGWTKMVLYWLKHFPMPLHVIVYENMTDNIPSELFKVGQFLNIKTRYIDLYCANSCLKPKYHRVDKPKWMTTTNLYDDQSKTIVNDAINNVIQTIEDTDNAHLVEVLNTYLM